MARATLVNSLGTPPGFFPQIYACYPAGPRMTPNRTGAERPFCHRPPCGDSGA